MVVPVRRRLLSRRPFHKAIIHGIPDRFLPVDVQRERRVRIESRVGVEQGSRINVKIGGFRVEEIACYSGPAEPDQGSVFYIGVFFGMADAWLLSDSIQLDSHQMRATVRVDLDGAAIARDHIRSGPEAFERVPELPARR